MKPGHAGALALGLAFLVGACGGGPDLVGDPIQIGGEGAVALDGLADFSALADAVSEPGAAVALPEDAPMDTLADTTIVVDDSTQSVVVQGVADTPAGDAVTSVSTFVDEAGDTQSVTVFALDDVSIDRAFPDLAAPLAVSQLFATYGGEGGAVPLSTIAAASLGGIVPETEPGSTTYSLVVEPSAVDGLAAALSGLGLDGPVTFHTVVPGEPFARPVGGVVIRSAAAGDSEVRFDGRLTVGPPTVALELADPVRFQVERLATLDVDGGLTFVQHIEASTEDAAAAFELLEPWRAPFELDWLTLDGATMVIGDAGVSVSGAADLDGLALEVELDLASATLSESSTVSVRPSEPVTLQDAVDLVARTAGIPAFPVGDGLALGDVVLRGDLAAAPPTLALAGTASIGAVDASLSVASARSSAGNDLVLVGFSLGAVTLGEVITAAAGTPVSDLSFPGARLLMADTGGAESVSIDPQSLPPGSFDEFLPDGGSLDVPVGVGFAGALSFSDLDPDFRDLFGLDPSAEVVVAGTVGASVASLTGGDLDPSLSLTAALTGAVFPDPPAPLVASGEGLVLGINYADGTAELEVTTAAVADVDGALRRVDLSARRDSAGVVHFRGELAEQWDAPFGVDWLTVGELRLEAQSGPDASVRFHATAEAANLLGVVDLELRSGGASFIVTLDGSTNIGELLDLATAQMTQVPFPDVDLVDRFAVGDITLAFETGSDPTFGITGTTSVDLGSRSLSADLALVSARQDGVTRFTLGFNVDGGVGLGDLTDDPPAGLEGLGLDGVAFVLSSRDLRFDRIDLTPVERIFYEAVYGSIDPDARIGSGLNLVATMDMPEGLEPLATALWIDSTSPFVLQGTIPGSVLGLGGSSQFGLSGLMPPITPPPGDGPEWLESGRLMLGVGAGSASLGGQLRIRVPNDASVSGSEVLTFGIESEVDLVDQAVELVGFFEADAWEEPFGIDWLTLNRVALLLGVTASPPALQLGFSGDAVIVGKDFQAALVVGFTPPPATAPVVLGARFATEAGLSLGDLVGLGQLLDPEAEVVDLSGLPDIGVQFVDLSFGLKSYPALDIKRGFIVDGDLYLGGSGDPGDPESLCIDRREQGCFASARIRVLVEGIEARGELAGFELGPIVWEDGIIDFVLTPGEQHLLVDGGAAVRPVLSGSLTLDIMPTAMAAGGTVQLHGYSADLQATSSIDLSGPEFAAAATFRSDFAGYVVGLTTAALSGAADRVEEASVIWDELETVPEIAIVKLEELLARNGRPIPLWLTALSDSVAAMEATIGRLEQLEVDPITPSDLVVAALQGFTVYPGSPPVLGRVRFGDCRLALPGEPRNCTRIPRIGRISIPGLCETASNVLCTARANAEPDLRALLEEKDRLTIAAGDLGARLPQLESWLGDILNVAIPVEVSCASVAGSLSVLQAEAEVETALAVRVVGETHHYSLAWDFTDGPGSASRLAAAIMERRQSSDLCFDGALAVPTITESIVDSALDEVETAPALLPITQTPADVAVAAEDTASIAAAEIAQREVAATDDEPEPPTPTPTPAVAEDVGAASSAPAADGDFPVATGGGSGGPSAGLLGAAAALAIGLAAGGGWWWRREPSAAETATDAAAGSDE